MSKGNQNGVARAEFQAIKQQLKTAGITEVAKNTKRSLSTISKIKRATSYAKFLELNKGYAAVQAKRRTDAKKVKGAATIASAANTARLAEAKFLADLKQRHAEQAAEVAFGTKAMTRASRVAGKSRKVKVVVKTPSDVSPLLDTLKKPERRNKAECKEVLDLRVQLAAAREEVKALRGANELLNDMNKQLNKELNDIEALEVIKKARAGRSFMGRLAQIRRKVGA